jgi:hypothetical protein
MRFDYAIFTADDRYVTNALLTEEEARDMERRGLRVMRVVDEAWQNVPAFRGRSYVTRKWPKRGQWRGR